MCASTAHPVIVSGILSQLFSAEGQPQFCSWARDGLRLHVASDDQGKVYLNGREIYQSRQIRDIEWLDPVGPVSLKRGVNVLLFKVVNESGPWEGCARLVDDAGRPVQGLRVTLTP